MNVTDKCQRVANFPFSSLAVDAGNQNKLITDVNEAGESGQGKLPRAFKEFEYRLEMWEDEPAIVICGPRDDNDFSKFCNVNTLLAISVRLDDDE